MILMIFFPERPQEPRVAWHRGRRPVFLMGRKFKGDVEKPKTSVLFRFASYGTHGIHVWYIYLPWHILG